MTDATKTFEDMLSKLLETYEQDVRNLAGKKSEVVFGLVRYEKDAGQSDAQLITTLETAWQKRMREALDEAAQPALSFDVLLTEGMKRAPNGLIIIDYGLAVKEAEQVCIDTSTYLMAEYIDGVLSWQYPDVTFALMAFSWVPNRNNPGVKTRTKVTAMTLESLWKQVLRYDDIALTHR